MRYVITGANRGIGLEFVRQLLARGDAVEAAVREPARAEALHALASMGTLKVHACDVGSDRSVASFGREVAGPIDVLVNVAGVMGRSQAFADLDLEDAARTFQVNALGPLRVTRALLPRLLEGGTRKVAHITSGMGSIGGNDSGGAYGYRMSKAALNMGSRSLALDLRGEGLISTVFNPGWVQTDMGGRGATISAEESVRKLLGLIDALTPEQSGHFLDYKGGELPW